MRIGIDARELLGRPTGVGRYLQEILEAWPVGGTFPHEIRLYVPSANGSPAREPSARLRGGYASSLVEVGGGAGTLWEQLHLPQRATQDRADVFFSPAYSTPIRFKGPKVVALHDLSFCAHPEWFSAREGFRRRWLARLSAVSATSIITDTQACAGEITEYLGVSSRKVRVIPLGAPPMLDSNNASREPVVLFSGSIFNRRHVPDLIVAFARVARELSDAELWIVGENRSYPREDLDALVRAEHLVGRVRLASYLPDADLHDLYRRARVFAFLSEYEGFGLTPLEALAAGVPVIVTDTPVAREVCGNAAVFVPKGDIDAIAAALHRLLTVPEARRDVLQPARAVLARYSWTRTAEETLAVIEAAAGFRSEL